MENKLKEKLRHLPDGPGAYLMKDEHGDVIYVGKAASLRNRVRSYFQKSQTHSPKTLAMLPKIADVDWLVTDSEIEALMLECNLIKQYHPWYNIRLRDDKHYPYICVTVSEPFPKVAVVRRVKQDGNKYFGPYADTSAMRESLRLIRKIFRIRGCNKKLTGEERDRPCLNQHMYQCDAPCAGRISREEYAGLVRDATLFLEGKQETLVKRIEGDMLDAAENLEFERAARLRDQVEALRKMAARQKAISTDAADQDVLALAFEGDVACAQVFFVRGGKLLGEEHFFLDGMIDETSIDEFIKQFYRDAAYVPKEILVSHEPEETAILEDWLSMKRGSRVSVTHPKRGEKRQLTAMAAQNALQAIERSRQIDPANDAARDLEALQNALNLPNPPARIEAYDISNLQGREAVGSMVVFENGVPAKSKYRRFKIRSGDQPDDYGMMREVLMRRMAQGTSGDPKFTPMPDLILIDGGKGQLNAALDAISGFEYDGRVISLAKRLEEVFVPGSSNPILLPRSSDALKLLQRVRDEAHRFALAYHHKLRDKAARKSILDSIPGIGDQRRKALVRKFGSVAGVRKASVEELLAVPGMTRSTAQAVYDFLNPG